MELLVKLDNLQGSQILIGPGPPYLPIIIMMDLKISLLQMVMGGI